MRTIIIPFYGYLNSRMKKIWNSTQWIKRTPLQFEEVGANVIAVDVIRQRLFYAKKTPGKTSCLIIDLHNLEGCSIKKEYNSINAGELKTRKLHHFLKSVLLNLVFKNETGTVSLPLYDGQQEQQDDVERLEVQAKKWETIVSKLRPIEMTRIA